MKPTQKTDRLTKKAHANHQATKTQRAERFAAIKGVVAVRGKSEGRSAHGHSAAARFEAIQRKADRAHQPRD